MYIKSRTPGDFECMCTGLRVCVRERGKHLPGGDKHVCLSARVKACPCVCVSEPACVGCVCAGAPGPGLWVRTGADGAQLTPSQGANGRKWRGPLATNTHRRSLTHRHIQHTRGCTYTSACVHVCAHVMTHALHQSPMSSFPIRYL